MGLFDAKMFQKPWLAPLGPGESAKGLPGDALPQQAVVVRYKGPFDWTFIYRAIFRWFEQRRFKVHEDRYKDTGKRIKEDMSATREIDEFFSETYKVKWEMWKLTRKEVVVRGEPRVIFNGMAQVTISGSITTDRAHMYKGNPSAFQRFLGNLLMDARWKEIEGVVIDTMEYRLQELQTMIKKAFNMSAQENAPWTPTTNASLPRV